MSVAQMLINKMKVNVNGTTYKSANIKAKFRNGGYIIIGTFVGNPISSITLSSPAILPYKTRLTLLNSEGTYDIVSPDQFGEGSKPQLLGIYSSNPELYFSKNGSITITEINENIISGIFNFESEDFFGRNEVLITEGEFSVKLQ